MCLKLCLKGQPICIQPYCLQTPELRFHDALMSTWSADMFQWTIFESDINITWVIYAKASDA